MTRFKINYKLLCFKSEASIKPLVAKVLSLRRIYLKEFKEGRLGGRQRNSDSIIISCEF
jgi:hypothetical protein